VGNAINKFRSPQRKLIYVGGGWLQYGGGSCEGDAIVVGRCRYRSVSELSLECSAMQCSSASGARLPAASTVLVANRVLGRNNGCPSLLLAGRRRVLNGCGLRWQGWGWMGGRCLGSGLACCTRAASVTSWGDPAYLSLVVLRKFSLKIPLVPEPD
jgi:hypothetical protein